MESVQKKIPIIIHRRSFDTAFGRVEEKTEEFKPTVEFVGKLKLLDTHEFSADNPKAVKIEDNYKQELHSDPKFVALGLRRLIRRDAGIMRFVLNFSIIK